MAHKQLGSRDYSKKIPVYKIGNCLCPKCATMTELYWTREELTENIKTIMNRSFTDPKVIFPELSTIEPEKPIDKKRNRVYNITNIENLSIFLKKE